MSLVFWEGAGVGVGVGAFEVLVQILLKEYNMYNYLILLARLVGSEKVYIILYSVYFFSPVPGAQIHEGKCMCLWHWALYLELSGLWPSAACSLFARRWAEGSVRSPAIAHWVCVTVCVRWGNTVCTHCKLNWPVDIPSVQRRGFVCRGRLTFLVYAAATNGVKNLACKIAQNLMCTM